MTKAQIAAQIKHIVQNQLDDCERAIKAGTRSIALKELEDAVRQLKRLAALLEALPQPDTRLPCPLLAPPSTPHRLGRASALRQCSAPSAGSGCGRWSWSCLPC